LNLSRPAATINRMTRIGSSVLRFDSVTSTNDVARELACKPGNEGAVIVAREQTAGKGRQGRSWFSPPDDGLYFSVILGANLRPASLPFISLAAAVVVAEALADEYSLKPDIKWPNDVLLGGRKVCGILLESATEADRVQYAVLGIGINLAGSTRLPEQIQTTSTTLLAEAGVEIRSDQLLQTLIDRLDYWCEMAGARPDAVMERWQQLSSYAEGCAVRITSANSTLEGVTRGLAPSGALRVESGDGAVHEVASGDVSLRRR
jgi:BirA family biotin operon repressor/biotin-[acetyl-CoA-carboxylase] ligase